MIDWSRFVELVRSYSRFLLTTHIRPDCDALGSQLAMTAILEHLGKEVLPVGAQSTPGNLRFIDCEGKLKTLDEVDGEQLAACEVVMVLDTTAWAQLGAMADVLRQSKAVKVVLDHHVSGDDLGAELFKDTSAEATGRLVAEAAEHLGVGLTPDIATAVFAAVATDTGWYRFSSTSAETYRLAARLVDAGAVPDAIYRQLYENETLGRLRLIGRTLARAETEQDGRLIYTWIERKDFDQVGAVASDSEDVINMTLAVGGVEVAVILVEQRSGGFKISFRSRSDLDCSRVAETFGGGGHMKAAGAFINEPLRTALAKVLDAVRAAMR